MFLGYNTVHLSLAEVKYKLGVPVLYKGIFTVIRSRVELAEVLSTGCIWAIQVKTRNTTSIYIVKHTTRAACNSILQHYQAATELGYFRSSSKWYC
jgi:hypothetical protein